MRADDWSLSDSPNAAVFTTRGLMDGSKSIARIIRDAEGGWQAIPAGDRRDDEAIVVCLADVLALSADVREAVRELDALPPGTQAVRRDRGWSYEQHMLWE
jgi:hypothetical protein